METLFDQYKELNINGSLICLEQVEDIYSYFCYPTNAKAIGFEGSIMYCFIEPYGEMVFACNPDTCADVFVYPLARTFEDFMRLILACGSTNPIEQIIWMDKDKFEKHLKEEEAIRTEEQKATLSYLETELEISPIDNPYDYVKELQSRFTDSNLNHTGIYLYSKGKIMIHLTFDYQSDEGCTTPGQYLRYHRTFQGLTTRELAEKVGVVPATLVLYENDRHPIKHSTAVALANVLGIDRSRLLDEYTVFVDYPYSSLLKKVRRELSFTQMQMAEVIGIGQTTYSGWEREVRVPRRKEHEKILAAMKKLKVDVDTYLCQPNPL